MPSLSSRVVACPVVLLLSLQILLFSTSTVATSTRTSGFPPQHYHPNGDDNNAPSMVDATRALLMRPRVDFTMAPHHLYIELAIHNTNDNHRQSTIGEGQRKLQEHGNTNYCDSILDTVFGATDELSLRACACTPSDSDVNMYTLSCDYSAYCGTFCTDADSVPSGQYDCFDRSDTYTIVVTEEFYINTLYEGCGTYVSDNPLYDGTTVCLTETRTLEGQLSGRCLDIDGKSCHCSQGLCGDYRFQCMSPNNQAKWNNFALDECQEDAYSSIVAGEVQGLLSGDVFSLDTCFEEGKWTHPPTMAPTGAPHPKETSAPTAAPQRALSTEAPTTTAPVVAMVPTNPPTSKIEEQQETSTSLGPSSFPTVAITATPSTAVPTEKQTTLPTKSPTTSPTSVVSELPSNLPSELPSELPLTGNPTDSPSIEPTPIQTTRPSVNPTPVSSLAPSSNPTLRPTTSMPTAVTIDRELEPFALWLNLGDDDEGNERPSSVAMVGALQKVLVNGMLREEPSWIQSLQDFVLSCKEAVATQQNIMDRVTRMECTGTAKFVGSAPIDNEIVGVQKMILLQNPGTLTELLAAQLPGGLTVFQIRNVEMERVMSTSTPTSMPIESVSAGTWLVRVQGNLVLVILLLPLLI